MFLVFPLFLLAAEIPLGLLWLLLSARIMRTGEPGLKANRASSQFRLVDLLAATTVVAVVLFLSKLAFATEIGTSSNEVWLVLMIGVAITMAYSALAAIPCLINALFVKQVLLGIIAIAFYSAVMTTIPVGILVFFFWDNGLISIDYMAWMIYLFHGSFVTVLFGALLFLRAAGYRLHLTLHWGRRESTPVILDTNAPAVSSDDASRTGGESPFAAEPAEPVTPPRPGRE